MQTLKAIIVCSPDALREQLDQVSGKMTLLRRLAALRPGPLTSTLASAKTSLRAIARRWLLLDAEIKQHDAHLEILTVARAPELLEATGWPRAPRPRCCCLSATILSASTRRQHSPSCAGPAQSRHQAARPSGIASTEEAIGGNAALYRVVITRMRGHQPTLDYVRRRTAEGKSRSEIIRCLKRYVAREIFGNLCTKPAQSRCRIKL